jgi:hypothetical protein
LGNDDVVIDGVTRYCSAEFNEKIDGFSESVIDVNVMPDKVAAPLLL